MANKLLILLLTVLSAINTVVAQRASIQGKILDENNAPLPFSTVMLKSSTDSSLVKGEVTSESGDFLFTDIEDGNYFLQIQSTGYQTLSAIPVEVAGGKDVDAQSISMHVISKELSAVNIQGEKPFIEKQSDKMVVNVDNSIVHAGSSVMEVFEKLPGVLIDQDGNIRLRGKQGVIVVIDGKPTALSGQDLANLLKGMPAANIQKVEIITNPSARWDAAGNSGILNIVMKKNRLNGFNGSANFTYGQGRYPKYNTSLSLNYKKDRMSLFFNYAYSDRKVFNNLMIDRRFYEEGNLVETYLTDNYIVLPFVTHNPRLGLDYSITNKTTVSLLGVVLSNEFKPYTSNHTILLGPDLMPTGSLDFSQHSKFTSFNYELNTQIDHKFDTLGQSLVINLDYGNYGNDSYQYNATLQNDFASQSTDNIILTSDQEGSLLLYSAKADYTKPFNNDFTLESGIKSSLVRSDKDMRFYDEENDSRIFNEARSSHFLYDENINAAYASLRKQIGKWMLQAGLRAEQTIADGLQKLNGQTFDRNYFQVFPTAYLNYVSGKHHVNLNLGRRINRPFYDQMNPFRRLIDHTTYAEGNPYLLPELTYVSELSYSFADTYFLNFNYSRTTDNITDVLIQDAQTRTTVQSVVNLNVVNFYNVDLTYSKRLMNWWKTNVNLQGYLMRFDGTIHDLQIDQGEPSFAFQTNNSFTITDNLSAELTFRFNYRNLYGVTTMRNSSNLTAGIQKSFYEKRLLLTVNMTDILWKAYPRGITEFGDVTEAWVSKRDTRVANVGLAYNFGKGKSRMRRNTGADEEKGRIG